MYIINTIPHGKCFVRYLRTRCFCIRNRTRSLRSLVWFLIRQQLVRKYRTPPLSMKYSLFPNWPPNQQKLETVFKKVYLLAFQCLPITTDAVPCILHMYQDISSFKTSQEIMIFKGKKNYINFVHTCSYSGPSILEKTKETKVYLAVIKA